MKRRRTRANGEGSVYQRKADGIWVGALVLANGRRKVIYGATRGKAVEKLSELKVSVATLGVPQTDERFTVESFFLAWLAENRPRLRPSSYRTYDSMVRIHIVPAFGSRKLTSLTTMQLERFLLSVPLAPKSVTVLKGVISGALADAVKGGYLRQNPAVHADTPKVVPRKVEPVGPIEARAIIKAFDGDLLAPLVTLALLTGLRQGELLALQPEDLDLKARRLRVRHTLQSVAGEYRLLPPKTSESVRTVPLVEQSVAAIEAQLATQQAMKILKGDRWKSALGLLFTTSAGAPLSGSTVTRKFQDKLFAAGLAPRRFHELRHGYATLLLSQGVDMRVIMELMGHTTMSMSLVYTHVVPELHWEAAGKLEDAIG